jgi:putative MATE family efflux protein
MKKTTLEKGFYKTALLLAFPIAMQNLLVSCAALVDTSMVMALGNVYTSAVGIAGRLAFFMNVVAFGFCSGSAALISQFWGAREKENIKSAYGTALAYALPLAFLFAVAFFLFPSFFINIFTDDPLVIAAGAEYLKYYSFACVFIMFSQITCSSLRATERVVLPLLSSVISVVVNTFLNYCLIGGRLGFPRLEMKGAAIATATGAVVQALVLLFFVICSRNPLRAKAQELFLQKKEFVSRFFSVSLPVLFNESLWALGTNVYAMVIARQGTDNHAAFTVYDSFQQLFFVFFAGMCNAAAIMVGKRIGEGNKDSAFATASRFVILTPTVGVIVAVFMVLLRMPILGILPVEKPETVALAATILLGYAVWLPFKMIPYTLICGVFRAGGDTKAGCVFDAASLYLFGIPTVVILGFFTSIPFEWLIWIMFIAEDIPKAVMCLPHFFRRKWIRELSDKALPSPREEG